MIWAWLMLMLLIGPAQAQIGLPAGRAQLAPGQLGCSNSLNFAQSCNSQYVAVVL